MIVLGSIQASKIIIVLDVLEVVGRVLHTLQHRRVSETSDETVMDLV